MKKNIIVKLLLIVFTSLICLCCFSGCVKFDNGDDSFATEITINTNIYFSDKNVDSLIRKNVTFKVKDNHEKYEKVLDMLADGPEETGMHPVMDPRSEINGIAVSDGMATVDLTEEFVEYNQGGSAREFLCIYSIVNSLCEFNEVDRVEFTVNGSKIEYFGHFDMTEPYEKDLSIVKQN